MPDKPPSATIRDVAQRAGVSVATVSRVLNKNARIAPDTEARVVAAISDLDYFPKAAARNLSNRKTNVIGLLLPGIQWDHFFPPMLRGIEAACYETGFELLISSNHRPDGSASLRQPVGEHNTDGLLLFPGGMADEEMLRLEAKGFPFVLLYRNSPTPATPIPHVVFENRRGARQIVNHLIEVHGYQRIGMLAGPADNEDAQWRERGYREALAGHGIPYNPDWVRPGEFEEAVARETVQHWLERGLDVQAIFAADDDSAYGAIDALRAAGKRIPEEIAIVGFDDSPVSHLLTPALTTIRAPIEQSGYQAARMLAELLQTGQTRDEVLLPTELIVRRSCGCH